MQPDLRTTCQDLAERAAMRRHYIKSINKQTNAFGALVRRAIGFDPNLPEGDREALVSRAAKITDAALRAPVAKEASEPIIRALAADVEIVKLGIAPYRNHRTRIEEEMTAMAAGLPAAAFVDQTPGLSTKGLAIIVGEAGDLSSERYEHAGRMCGYDAVDPLWKRLGLAPYNGFAASSWRVPSRHTGAALTADEWTGLGYKPTRRAEIFAFLEDNFLNAQIVSKAKSGTPYGAPKTRYGAVYVARRERTGETHPDWSPAHAKQDATRVMAKHVIRDLWRAWNSLPPRAIEAAMRLTTPCQPALEEA